MDCQFTRLGLFHQIMRIANPEMQEVDFKDMDTCLIISNFTRIFNIRQILYVFSVCNSKIQGMKTAIKLLENTCQTLSEEFKKTYKDYSLDGINVYALMEMELRTGFGGSDYTSMDIMLQMNKIALAGLMAEVNFQFKWADYCILTAKSRLKNQTVMKRKAKRLVQNAEKRKKFWMWFESEYKSYIETVPNPEHMSVHVIGNEELFPKFEQQKIHVSSMVLKNTISFIQHMDDLRGSAVANTFFALYEPYMSELDADSMNMQLLSGHIQYFRAANVTKMMYLMEQCQIDYIFKGYDMSVFLSKPLSVAGFDLSNPLCVGEEQIVAGLNHDMEVLSDGYNGFTEPEVEMFLFCSYLNIEREWMVFEAEKEETQLLHIIAKGIPYVSPSFGAYLVDEWYGHCCAIMKYHEKQNLVARKIIQFQNTGR